MNQPFNSITASSIGCVLDCNLSTGLKIGGGTATDNRARINALFATASASNPISLILDGPSLITGSIDIPNGHVTLVGIGWDSGFYVANGSNSCAMRIGNPNSATNPGIELGLAAPAQSCVNVTLRDFYINCNRGDGTTGNSTSGNPRGGPWLFGIDVANCQHILFDHLSIYDTPTYAIRMNNWFDAVVSKCTIISPCASGVGGPYNCDGIHMDGPGQKARISDCYINNNFSDDGIAINSPEGYGGLIDGVQITNCNLDQVAFGIRSYGATKGEVGAVVVSNCIARVTNAIFLFGAGGSGIDAGCRSFDASNCTVTNNNSNWGSVVAMSGGVGDLTLSNVKWLSPISSDPFIWATDTTSSCTLVNCSIYRTTDGYGKGTANLLGSKSSGTITQRMTINGFRLSDESGQVFGSVPFLINMLNLTINELYIASLDPTNITALADDFTNIHNISGPGVLASGFQIPDSSMANNTPYISATAPNVGKPCIKLAGVVHTLNYT